LAIALTTQGAPMMPSIVTTINAKVNSRATRSSSCRTSSGDLVVRACPSMGTKACEKAPSAKRRLRRLGMRNATQKASVSGPAPKAPAIRMSRISPVIREKSVRLLTVAADLNRLMEQSRPSFWCHTDGSVQAYGFPVDHLVGEDAAYELGVVFWTTEPRRKRNAGSQRILHFLRHAKDHGCAKNARGDRYASDADLGEI